jgi:hypothetical protein
LDNFPHQFSFFCSSIWMLIIWPGTWTTFWILGNPILLVWVWERWSAGPFKLVQSRQYSSWIMVITEGN